MSAVLRLTEESLVIEKGKLAMRAPSGEAVDYYLSRGYSLEGQRVWHADEISQDAYPFQPVAIRVKNPEGTVVDTVRSIQTATIELEYNILAPMTGLRVGIYLISTRGEYIFTSFDTDDAGEFERFGTRQPGTYRSRCVIPADTLNEGRYIIGVNASTYRIKRYFQDEQALTFNVDAAGAPGMQWPEPRLGSYRPRLNWEIERV
jgi:lipopolysaccharide transport system ATP-binding protein